jgi:hypothetical protein
MGKQAAVDLYRHDLVVPGRLRGGRGCVTVPRGPLGARWVTARAPDAVGADGGAFLEPDLG